MTATFVTAADEATQAEVGRIVAERWSCEVYHFGRYSPVDWWLERAGKVVAIAEFKARQCETSTYPTVFLAVQKWLSLSFASMAFGCAGLFVVGYRDGIRFVDVRTLTPSSVSVAGRDPRPGSVTDQEPIIEVPLTLMRALGERST